MRGRMALPTQLSDYVFLVVYSFHRAASACARFLLITFAKLQMPSDLASAALVLQSTMVMGPS